MQIKKITYIALLSAVSLLFGYIESLFPVVPNIPGIKLGLANIVVLFALCRLDRLSAFLIMLIKVFVSSLLFSGMNVLLYSLGGGILSVLLMITSRRLNFSIIGVSILGGIFHNVGQLSVAALMLGTYSVFYYTPYLIISGILAGLVTGTVCKKTLLHLDKFTF